VILEKTKSRNHTELMVNGFGGCVTYEKKPSIKEGEEYDNIIIVNPTKELFSTKIRVPGDISSAAFFMVAGLLVPNSEILIKNVGLNPTRTGIIEVLEKMGGDITIENPRQEIEPVGDIRVKTSALKGTKIGGNLIPRLIDELPILTVAASFASGTTVIGDAEELKVKESNRIDAMATELKKAGVDVEPTEDGLIINGTINKNKNDKGANDTELEGLNLVKGAKFHTYNDHRIAMSLAVLALMAEGSSEIVNHECVNVSYPDFFDNLSKLNKEVF
ncbi:MAG: 3-phosphoshikimate 1-carboxyvinyltransferase, partial [Anaerovorax sp.]